MQSEVSEAELLNDLRRGDQEALAELLGRYQREIRGTIAVRLDRRVATRLSLSDVVQDVFVEAQRRLLAYGAEPSPMPIALWFRWLARESVLSANRRHLAACRAVGRELPPLPAESSVCVVGHLLGREPTGSHVAATVEAVEMLRQAISRLDDEERDVILWRHFEDLQFGEIAALLGVSPDAARKRYVRALERLRGVFGPADFK